MQRCWSKATNRDAASNVDEKESEGMEQLYQQRRGGQLSDVAWTDKGTEWNMHKLKREKGSLDREVEGQFAAELRHSNSLERDSMAECKIKDISETSMDRKG